MRSKLFPWLMSFALLGLFTTVCARQSVNTAESKALVEAYMNDVVAGKDGSKVGLYVADTLIQHNPNLADGREALRTFWTNFFAEMPEADFRIVRVVAEDDLVVVHSHFTASPDDLGAAVVDIFRVENDRIVEHWDVSMPIPEETVSGNPVVD